MSAPTSPEISHLLDDLQDGIASVLGDDFVGLYLFGSLVYGDFTDSVSDIDLLAVSRHVPTESDLDRLRGMHREIVVRHSEWEDRVEAAYQSLHGLRTFRTERSPMGITSPGEPLHLIDAGDDWLINYSFVLDHGVTLAGPPPDTIIAPISHAMFVEAARNIARDWARRIHDVQNQRGESYAILTVSRALYTHRTGQLVSKQAAARWVKATYPPWSGLVDMALERRISPEDNGPVDTFQDTIRFIAMVNNEISDQQSASKER